MVSDQIKSAAKRDAVFTIEKRGNLSQEELVSEYVEPSIPVVLKADATQNWKAIGKFTPKFFKENYGNVSKNIGGTDYKMSDVIDLILAGNPDKKAPYPYSFDMEKYFPELLDDLKPEIIFGKSDRINHPLLPKLLLHGTTAYEIFFGGKGSFFPFLHIDALKLHTQITQLYGSKDFILFSPDQTPYMYPSPENPKFSWVDIFNPDYEKYPLFRNARPIKVTLNEGETIIFPTGWWHSTQIHEPCISFGRSQLNAANWNGFIDDNYLALKKRISYLASPILAYGKITGNIINKQESKV